MNTHELMSRTSCRSHVPVGSVEDKNGEFISSSHPSTRVELWVNSFLFHFFVLTSLRSLQPQTPR